MAKILSFASWNVEHFHNDLARVQKVVDILKVRNPDIFGIYEVLGKDVFYTLMNQMPTHSFFITENNDSNMEILVGYRKSLNVFVTQRNEFRSKVPTLRPGTLATVRKNNQDYAFLFVHLKSLTDPRAWGLRDNMFSHSASLKRTLDKTPSANPTANFVILGDLNTMGLNAPYNNVSDIDSDQEIMFLDKRMQRVNMRRLTKTHELTWWNGSSNFAPGSKLDHVYADNNLNFKLFSGSEIDVIGWPQKSTNTQKLSWINSHSDHALLYGEIHS